MEMPTKEQFLKMSTNDKSVLLDDKIKRKEILDEYLFDHLSKSQREEYINFRIKTADWLEDFEFRIMSTKQKKQYIYRKRYLSKDEFMRLSDNLKKFYIEQASYTAIDLGDDEFESLSYKLKTHYCDFAFDFPLELDAVRAKYLSKSRQNKFIDKWLERGRSFSKEEYDSLNPSMKKYYDKQRKEELNEVRKVVRGVLFTLLK